MTQHYLRAHVDFVECDPATDHPPTPSVFPPYENFETETIITIPKNEHSYIKLNPSLIHAEDSLRSILIEDRECVFEDEVRLDYFNYYTQPICRMECYLQHALPSCGCVIFSARRILGTFNHPYCNESQYGCLSKELSNLLITPLVKPKQVGGYDKCACVPACSSLRYDLQTSYQQIITPTTLPLWADDYNESAEEDFARVSVFFHEQQFSTIDRKRTSTLGNFLGSCGGLLGLFLGFSFMSLFEIIYFALIRPVNRLITSYIQNR
ncbi:acid-sensing ion channel 1B-like [Macrosteles quadrilineatus]|uniref:acid-sensing ion channel 1B-like n=1 Tax=Macrosteles quadrilineatus TaxID=74068 RepID=UPI0023E168CE|nr:acid-sensing ion channel 1B-like [Macrosteles quadrilineatus]